MTNPFVINRITFPYTRLVDEDENYHENYNVYEAKKQAEKYGLQLVCFSYNRRDSKELPLCKIIDYGKWKYNEEKSKKKINQENKHVIKDVRFSARTEQGDLEHKIKHIIEFLENGDQVVLQMKIEGRDLQHMDIANEKMDDVLNKLETVATVSSRKIVEGRRKTIVVKLSKKEKEKK